MASISKIEKISFTIKTMVIDPINPKHLIADEGMALLQISSNIIMGKEVYLKMVVIDGKLINDFPENYKDVEEPQPDKDKQE